MKKKEKIDLELMRENYTKGGLVLKDLVADPVDQFNVWMKEAVNAKILEPNAMVLSTVDEKGTPSSRVVLLKDIMDGQFIFYTNYDSAKAREVDTNPHVALNFLWKDLQRQVRIIGTAKKTSEEDSNAYFRKRPRGSQIGAWVSPQSKEIASRSVLVERQDEIEEKFKGKSSIPLPPNWGGYGITPTTFEFWQGRPSRLHDRFKFILDDGKWSIIRLAP